VAHPFPAAKPSYNRWELWFVGVMAFVATNIARSRADTTFNQVGSSSKRGSGPMGGRRKVILTGILPLKFDSVRRSLRGLPSYV
jgi:hypothetical protein